MMRLTQDERGTTAIVTALLVTVFVGFLAIVVDVGYMYVMRRQLQSAADAAALAGMGEKIKGATDEEVLAVSEDYAFKNDMIGKPDALELVTDSPNTEVAENYVKIAVRKPARLFFAPILGYTQQMVYAQAKAKRVYVTGARGLVPWGIATIIAQEVRATVNGTVVDLSYNSATDAWEGALPEPATPSADGYPVDLAINNGQGFAEHLPDVGSIMVHAPEDTLANAYLSENVLNPGGSTYLYVSGSQAPTKAKVDNQTYTSFSVVGPDLYRTLISAPAATEPFQTFSIDIRFGNETFGDAARLIVRESNSPVAGIDFGSLHSIGGGGAVPLSVSVRDFSYSEIYNLKIVANPETGNFNALDFRYIYDPPDYTDSHGENDSAADYYDNLAGAYSGVVHIGDIITSKTGNLSGPRTTHALDTRIGGCTMSFSEWEVDKPADCGKLVAVPIIEHFERVTGQTDVKVVAIAIFFIESYETIPGARINIAGRFVRYARTGEYSDTPPDSGLYMETVRLDKPDY